MKTAFGLLVVAVLIAACNSHPDYDNRAICIDRVTQQRLPDEQCDYDHPRSNVIFWYFVAGQMIPPIGSRPTVGSAVRPYGSYRTGAPRTGMTVAQRPAQVAPAPRNNPPRPAPVRPRGGR